MTGDIESLLGGIQRRTGASDDAIRGSENLFRHSFPVDYIQFLKSTNGGEGFIADDAYVAFLRVEELFSVNQSYEVQRNAPGLLIIGSDGGGEAYGYDTRRVPWTIVRMPFVGMGWESAYAMKSSFKSFLEHLHES